MPRVTEEAMDADSSLQVDDEEFLMSSEDFSLTTDTDVTSALQQHQASQEMDTLISRLCPPSILQEPPASSSCSSKNSKAVLHSFVSAWQMKYMCMHTLWVREGRSSPWHNLNGILRMSQARCLYMSLRYMEEDRIITICYSQDEENNEKTFWGMQSFVVDNPNAFWLMMKEVARVRGSRSDIAKRTVMHIFRQHGFLCVRGAQSRAIERVTYSHKSFCDVKNSDRTFKQNRRA